jgi:hypothetical protein
MQGRPRGIGESDPVPSGRACGETARRGQFGVSTPIENCMDLAAENCMPTIFIAA